MAWFLMARVICWPTADSSSSRPRAAAKSGRSVISGSGLSASGERPAVRSMLMLLVGSSLRRSLNFLSVFSLVTYSALTVRKGRTLPGLMPGISSILLRVSSVM